MKKSTQVIAISAILAIMFAIVAVVMAYCCFLPGLFFAAEIALCWTICTLFLLFIMSAISLCKCLRRLFLALCRYGAALTITLIIALLTTLGLLIIPDLAGCFPLFLTMLFLSAASFLFSLFLFAAMIYAMSTMGCPHCHTPVARPCNCSEEADFSDFTA